MTLNANSRANASAQWLMGQHDTGNTFTPLAGAYVPADMAAAYDVQDALVALRGQAWHTQRVGY